MQAENPGLGGWTQDSHPGRCFCRFIPEVLCSWRIYALAAFWGCVSSLPSSGTTSQSRALPPGSVKGNLQAWGTEDVMFWAERPGPWDGAQSWISGFQANVFPLTSDLTACLSGCILTCLGFTHWTHLTWIPPQRRWPASCLLNVWNTVALKSAALTMPTQCWWWTWCLMVRKCPHSAEWIKKMWLDR